MAKARSGVATIASCLTALSLSIGAAHALEQKALKNDGLPVGQATDLPADDFSITRPTATQPAGQNLSKKELKRRTKESKEKEKEQEKDDKEKQKQQEKAEKEKQKSEVKTAPVVSKPTTGTTAPNSGAATSSDQRSDNLAALTAPIFLPDTALVSILKDVERTLKLPDYGAKSDDPNQRAALAMAVQILEKTLELPNITSDRIVRQSELSADKLIAEAWASGEVTLADGSKGSLCAVWAKRENGLVSIDIAGDSANKAPSGRPIGQFIVIVTGKSAVDKGFDIQSQAQVEFWIGKVSNVAIESTCSAPAAAGAPGTEYGAEQPLQKKSQLPVLQTVITERSRQYLAKLRTFRDNQIALRGQQGVAPGQQESAPGQQVFSQGETAVSPARDSVISRFATAPQSSLSSSENPVEDLPLRGMIGPGSTSATEPVETRTEINHVVNPSDADFSVRNFSSAKTEQLNQLSMPDVSKPNLSADAGFQPTAPPVSNSPVWDESSATVASADKSDVTSSVPAASVGGASKPGATSGSSAPGESTVAVSVKPDAISAANVAKPAETSVAAAAKPDVTTSAPAASVGGASKPSEISGSSAPGQTSIAAASKPGETSVLAAAMPNETPVSSKPVSVASLSTQLHPANSSSGWESPAQTDGTRQPTLGATLVVPERAIAGQFLTTAVIDTDGNAEQLVELSFNGSPSPTDKSGQVSYMVPEDATPGHSLTIALAQRPELAPTAVDVLQPLTVASQKEAPAIDKVVEMPGIARVAVIEGHNFDGFAEHNRVLIDGSSQAKVLSASPVELKVQLPESVQAGTRSITVEVAEAHSNAGALQYVIAQVRADAKEAKKGELTKLFITIAGSTERKQIHITNQNPATIKLNKGDDFRITTPGGENNTVTIGVERLRAGNYKVTARIE